MSFEQTLLVFLTFVAIIFSINFYLVKVLKIKRTKKKTFDKGREKLFIISEVSLMIGFIIGIFVIAAIFPLSTGVASLPLLLFFALLFLIRGIEEFIYNKEAKGYYHDWIGSFCFVCTFTFLFFAR